MQNEISLPGFDPKPVEYPFGEYTDQHYLIVKKNDGTVFDADYPYVDNSASARRQSAIWRALLFTAGYPVMRVRLGLRIRGKENLKKHKDALSGGFLTCANHVHLWDFMAIMRVLRRRKPHVIIWAPNIRGENGKMMRGFGGIPVPEGSPKATAAFASACTRLLESGEWLHVYPEGSMWEYYRPIRPFKTGAAYFACRTGKPVLPMAFSYRRPGFIRRKIFGQTALFTLNVGEPLLPDPSLPRREAENDLTVRMHDAVCRLAGIDPAENPYPPVFDKSKRIDYYGAPAASGEKDGTV